jgi:predicted nucleotidyltransferase
MVPEAFEFELKEITSASMSRDETIQELLRRLVEFYQPERVYLFGSAARSQDGPDSDFDLCVVLPDHAAERLFRDRSIHEHFWGLKAAVDVVRFASSDFDARAAHVAASLPASIMREGELLYDARRIAA